MWISYNSQNEIFNILSAVFLKVPAFGISRCGGATFRKIVNTLNFKVKAVLDKLTACFVENLPMNTASQLTTYVFTGCSVIVKQTYRNQLH
jgi:hypothetical protein